MQRRDFLLLAGSAAITPSALNHGRKHLETAPTEFVTAAGITFAYRRLGPPHGIPLVLLQHFSGNMDSWDPASVDRLAQERPIVVFDNTGVGQSSGSTPDSVARMAEDAASFIAALGFFEVDLLGFSLGGMVAQYLAAKQPALIRKVVVAGTAPQGGEEHLLAVLAAGPRTDAPDIRLPVMFTPSPASQAAGLAFLRRVSARTVDRDPSNAASITGPQARAIIEWCAQKDPRNAILNAITQPALIVCGSDDAIFPDQNNSYFMFHHLANAQLVLYPDSGHGALFQYPELFASDVSLFLRGD